MLCEISECTSPVIKFYVRQGPRPPQSYSLCTANRHIRNVYVPGTWTNRVIYLPFTRMFVGFQYVVGLKKPSDVKTRPSVFTWNSVIPQHRCLQCNISSDEHWNGGIFILTLKFTLLITSLPVVKFPNVVLFFSPLVLVVCTRRYDYSPTLYCCWPQYSNLFITNTTYISNVMNTIYIYIFFYVYTYFHYVFNTVRITFFPFVRLLLSIMSLFDCFMFIHKSSWILY